MNPHQVDALLALGSPLSKGALLADEVGLQDYRGGLSEGHFWSLQFAHDRHEAKRQIAQSARKD
jgi:hypothetical protein